MKNLLLAVALCLLLPLTSDAKSYSSGSHSYSSHSSSSSSHSSSFSSHSSSGSSTSSSHSYSSGSHSYASGGSSTKPSNYATKTGTSGSGYKSTSGKTYTTTHNAEDSTPSHTYSTPTGTTAKTHTKISSTYDSDAALAQQKDESRQTYSQAKTKTYTSTPTATYTAPVDNSYTYTPPVHHSYTATSSAHNNSYIPSTTIVTTRPARLRQFYTPYYGRTVSQHYNDPYNDWFWLWLLDQSINTQANWAYHHRYSMDPTRYQLLMQNQTLASQVQQLESQQVARNVNYTPYGMQQQDLMYNDQYIHQATAGNFGSAPSAQAGHALFVVFGLLAAITVGGCLIWLVFIHRWN